MEGLGDWPFLKGIGPARRATATGTLFGLPGNNGWFPALLPGEGPVIGDVHEAGGVDIPAMDEFEGADYARMPITVETDSEVLEAQAYLWIADLPAGAECIAHGDFALWLRETGRSPITS